MLKGVENILHRLAISGQVFSDRVPNTLPEEDRLRVLVAEMRANLDESRRIQTNVGRERGGWEENKDDNSDEEKDGGSIAGKEAQP